MREHLKRNWKSYGGTLLLPLTITGYFLAVQLSFQDAFRGHTRFSNGWALGLSLCSGLSLAFVYRLLLRWAPSAEVTAETPSLTLPRRQQLIAIALGIVFVAICLPATFRSVNHPREVQVFWVDEGDTLTLVQKIVTGENEVPHYRFTQGWVTFLPVALALKTLNYFVPVEFILTNVAMRSYLLLVLFGVVYCTYRLIWRITRSWWLSAAVVAIAYTRWEFFHIGLAIDRPDTFQLLFTLLSLLFAHRFWAAGQMPHFFLAVFFAAFAFASKYSGHLLAPVLLLVFSAHWRRPEVAAAYASAWRRWAAGAVLFSLSMALIFPFTFFVLSPYHLIYMENVIDFFQTHLVIYKSGNVYSLPNHEQPSHVLLWWGVFTSGYVFDYVQTVLGLAGVGTALVVNLIRRASDTRAKGEWLLLAWGACYLTFLVYQYGLVDYRYIMPAQFVLPFFLLLPIYWLQQSTALSRVPYRTALGFCALGLLLAAAHQRIGGTLGFLGRFRSEASVQQCFDVGRYLDKAIAPGENVKVLSTNVAYFPPRLQWVEVRNVDVTLERVKESRFDFVIMTDNMYAIYADKPTAGHDAQFDPLYKVHYVDVVAAYTKFRHNAHPDYRHVASFQDYHVFERVDRMKQRVQVARAE